MAGNEPVQNARILINGDTIERVSSGDGGGGSLPAGTRVINADGKYIIPGLIDSHVHYNWYMGELFLNHGITTVYDLGSRIHWQTAVQKGLNSGALRGPRFFFCGRIGINENGDDLFTSVSELGDVPEAIAVLKEKADCIKLDKDAPGPLYTAITREARAAGISVIAHSYDAMKSASMGLHGLEHLEGVAISTIRSEEGRRALQDMPLEEGHKHPMLYPYMEPAYFDEVIRHLVEHDVWVNPTWIHEWKGIIDRTPEFETEDLRLLSKLSLQYMPLDEKLVSLSQYHWADELLFPEEGMDGNYGDRGVFVNNSYYLQMESPRAQFGRGYRNIQEFLRRFVEAGGKLFSGTDTAASNTPGLSLHHEMQLFVDAGLSEMDVLASSTSWAAEFLHLDDRLGNIEPGKLADIVILDGNPLEDIGNTKAIDQVIKNGEVVDIAYHRDYQFPFHQYGYVSKHQYHQPPVLHAVKPGIVVQGGTSELRIYGRHFVPDSVALFDGMPVTTEWISANELAVTLSPRETSDAGSYLIQVSTPKPGGGTGGSLEFIVDYGDVR